MGTRAGNVQRLGLIGPTVKSNVRPSRPSTEAVSAGRLRLAHAGRQLVGGRDLVQDDRAIADGRSDDLPSVGTHGLDEAIEVGSFEECGLGGARGRDRCRAHG